MAGKKNKKRPRFENDTVAPGVTKTATRRDILSVVEYRTTLDEGGFSKLSAAFMNPDNNIDSLIAKQVSTFQKFLRENDLPSTLVVYQEKSSEGLFEVVPRPPEFDLKKDFKMSCLHKYVLAMGYRELADETVAARIVYYGLDLLKDGAPRQSLMRSAMNFQRALMEWHVFKTKSRNSSQNKGISRTEIIKAAIAEWVKPRMSKSGQQIFDALPEYYSAAARPDEPNAGRFFIWRYENGASAACESDSPKTTPIKIRAFQGHVSAAIKKLK